MRKVFFYAMKTPWKCVHCGGPLVPGTAHVCS